MTSARGRPPTFDYDKALDEALKLFWERGYPGTSYAGLCLVTGLSKPSLYAAFGNKQEMFLAALDRYLAHYVVPGFEALEAEPDVRLALHQLLVATVDSLTAEGIPKGCMIATNTACSAAPEVTAAVAQALLAAAGASHRALSIRLDRALAECQLPPGTDIPALVRFYDTLITGLSGLAKQGVPRTELMKAVDIAMLVWSRIEPA